MWDVFLYELRLIHHFNIHMCTNGLFMSLCNLKVPKSKYVTLVARINWSHGIPSLFEELSPNTIKHVFKYGTDLGHLRPSSRRHSELILCDVIIWSHIKSHVNVWPLADPMTSGRWVWWRLLCHAKVCITVKSMLYSPQWYCLCYYPSSELLFLYHPLF